VDARPDFTSRRRDDYRCKHGLAVWLYGIAQERAAVLAERLAQAFSVEDQKRIEFARWLVQAGRIGEAA
jgi:ABC-type hemin transport system ATPase subunit